MSAPSIRDADGGDAEACAAIYAPYVTEAAISFAEVPPTAGEMADRIAAAQRIHAWVVLERHGCVLLPMPVRTKSAPRIGGRVR